MFSFAYRASGRFSFDLFENPKSRGLTRSHTVLVSKSKGGQGGNMIDATMADNKIHGKKQYCFVILVLK